MKRGDKVLCKKSGIGITIGKEYTIIYTGKISIMIVVEGVLGGNATRTYDLANEFDFLYDYFYDYFYSPEELRQLKLQSL